MLWEHDSLASERVHAKPLVNLDLISKSPLLAEGTDKQFARRILQSISCQ